MIKTTTIIIALAALNIGAANPDPDASLMPQVTSVNLQLSHLDIQSGAEGLNTTVVEDADFALRLTLKSGRVVSVRF
ncbi:hypothetical protein ACJ3XI_09495 [Litorimonas sp. RW-G-Af-16]|uniref:hypothetical protein n=1 Tax=Litorimonas sp. RW-G-Af-16 TaxID=3241168 RepID=UPI00390CBF88